MSTQGVATVLGVLASFLLALAAFLQQRAARTTTRRGRSLLGSLARLMGSLVRHPTWLMGWLVNLVGFFVQALALHLGSVASVQPLLATQLLFALPMASLERRRWPRPRDWVSAALICAGLVLLLGVVQVTDLDGAASRARVVLAVVAVVAVIVVAIPLAARLGSPKAVLLVAGSCSGLCFAMTAVFIKLTATDLVDHGVGYTARDWVGYALAASTLVGLVLEQVAFANGPLPWAVATKEAVNPLASYAIGVLAFPVVFPTDPGTLAAVSGAGLLIVLGAWGLGGSTSVRDWLVREEDRHEYAKI
ncbi:MAG TPA: DMT family transporter [Nocardioides sp.]|uniref:DMT family transporter n=1 Tax=Nocardioides sp. TaxID=35761 RepID=UPI002E33D921|nr:DMT family transporter [Nocardioides sp.]HEX5087651.1 DMT family transporter [Nocardioides sp.]